MKRLLLFLLLPLCAFGQPAFTLQDAVLMDAVSGSAADPAAPNTLTNGLIAYWRLDSDAVWPDALGVYSLTEAGTVTGTIGIVTNAGVWNGSSDQLSSADDDVWTITESSLTVMGWTYLSVTNQSNTLVAKDSTVNGSREWRVSAQADGLGFAVTYYTNAATTTPVLAAQPTPLETGKWYLFCAEFDATNSVHKLRIGTTNTLYDWSSSGAWSRPAVLTNTTAILTLGKASTLWLSGYLDEVGIWRRLLTDAEIDTFRTNTATLLTSYPFSW